MRHTESQYSGSPLNSKKNKKGLSLDTALGLAGLIVGLVACFDDCGGAKIKVYILEALAGMLAGAAFAFLLYRIEVAAKNHIVIGIVGILAAGITVLLFIVAGCNG